MSLEANYSNILQPTMKQVHRLGIKRSIICLFFAVIFTVLVFMNTFDLSLISVHVETERTDGEQIMLTSSGCQHGEPIFKEITQPFSALVFVACGHLLERIHKLNEALEQLRFKRFLPINRTSDWNISESGQLKLLAEWNENFFKELSNYSQIKTVILPWLLNPQQRDEDWSSLTESSNLLIREYYESTATDPLCTWIETPGKVEFSFDVINNWTCNRNTTLGTIPRSLSLLALNAKPPYKGYYFPSAFPDKFFTELPQILHTLYIIRSGIVSDIGNVFIRDAKIVPYACFPEKTLNLTTNVPIDELPLYEEVFVITQSYGSMNYHRLAETTPRISLYVDFLVRNPTIKILAPETYGLMAELIIVLGINRDRIISGWCRAEVIYLPRATTCCLPQFLETQVLSLHYRKHLKKAFPKDCRNKVVFIRRSGRRHFNNESAIERVVELAAKDYNLSYDVFNDIRLPSFVDMMRLFNSAVMVVGPHGAGLANLVFSEPGTFVIEGVCNRPHTNLFFHRTAQILGHRYHGIPSSGGCFDPGGAGVGGVVTVEPSIINDTIRTYLDLWDATTTFRNNSSYSTL